MTKGAYFMCVLRQYHDYFLLTGLYKIILYTWQSFKSCHALI